MSRLLGLALAGVLSSIGTIGAAATYSFEFTSTTHTEFDPTFDGVVANDADDYRLGETFVTTLNFDTGSIDPGQTSITSFDILQSATLFRASSGETFDLGLFTPNVFLFPRTINGFAQMTVDADPINRNENAIFITLRASLGGASLPATPDDFFNLLLARSNTGVSRVEFGLGGGEPILGLEAEDIPSGIGFVEFSNELTAATVNGIKVDLAPVPLPAAGFLLAAALLGASGLRRKG